MRPTTIASVSDVVLLWTRDLAGGKNEMVDVDVFSFKQCCQAKIHGMALMEPGYLVSWKQGIPMPMILGRGVTKYERSLFGHSRIEFAPVAAGRVLRTTCKKNLGRLTRLWLKALGGRVRG